MSGLSKLWTAIERVLGEALRWLPMIGPLLNERIKIKMTAGDAAAVLELADAIDEYRAQWGDVSAALRAGVDPDSVEGRNLTVEETAVIADELADTGPAAEALFQKIRAL